jgi:hypothetical protein
MPNCSIYKNGVNAALKAGTYKPANYAACKLKQVTGSAKSSGYGQGGRRTLKASRKSRRSSSRRSSTRRMRGGANDACVAALRRVLPEDGDYDRMQGYESKTVNSTQGYDAWVEGQIARANALPPAECEFLTALCSRVNKIKLMDLESCSDFGAAYVFFDKAGKLVIANPR